MTLPHLGVAGLPVPEGGEVDEVVGLAGRLRLSRPAESASAFSPSAVFSSSHGLNRVAAGLATPSLLPSQTVKAIDRQRQDLVAYEYLCHVEEAKRWLESTISSDTAAEYLRRESGESTSDFEQSLRNGYILAHLARTLGSDELRNPARSPIFNDPQLQYRHIGNIEIFFKFVKEVLLPETFRFETVDLYDGKNLPKVIFCVHALGQLLARRGLTAGMSNLVNELEFSEHELNAAQKNLQGLNMPNFNGIGKTLNRKMGVVPEESEEELERKRAEEKRKAEEERLRAEAEERHRLEEEERQRAEQERLRLQEQERRRAEEEKRRAEEETRRAEEERVRREEAERVRRLQLEEEARKERLRLEEEARQERLRLEAEAAAAREAERRRLAAEAEAEAERQRVRREEEKARQHAEAVRQAGITLIGFQAHARGVVARRRVETTLAALHASESDLERFQAQALGVIARRRLLDRIRLLRSTEDVMVGVQSQVRGVLARRALSEKMMKLRQAPVVRSVGGFQSLARAQLVRRKVELQRKELLFVEPDVVGVQAQVRGYLGKMRFFDWQDHVAANIDQIIELQALIRGTLAKRKFTAVRQHFHQNLQKVVRLQAAIRSRRQGSQYRQLRMGTNVPVSTIKNFVRLLDDSEFDYREELQVESMRKELVKTIRDTQELEDDVKDLDTKIALLVKNKITHEVARAQRAATGGLGANVRNSLLAAANDPFAPDALDRQTQRKLELYQQLFGLLQTSPMYLAKLLASTSRAGMSEKLQKQVEQTTFVVFGFAQNQREEFLLLKLFQRSIQEELEELPDIATFTRVNLPFVRLLMQYGRGVNQKKYLKDLLAPQVQAIIDDQHLDLTCEPRAIYRADIAAEETRTGRPSSRPKDVSYEQALSDPNSKKVFLAHLLALRKTVDSFLQAIFASTARVPFGIRYVGREVFRALQAKFPNEPVEEILRVVSHLVYYRFIQPAAVAPETFDIIQGVVIPPRERKNLAEACKLLNQITTGRLFNEDVPFMVPMNQYIGMRAKDFTSWIQEVIEVPDAEIYFKSGEYTDATAARRPVIYISPNAIYATHSLMASNLDTVAPERDDPLRLILVELGGVPAATSNELTRARADEVPLTLVTRVQAHDDPDAKKKALFNQAKRRVLAVLKVHHGTDLEAVLAQPVTQEDEDSWNRIVEEEEEEERRQAHQQRRRVIPMADDIRSLSFRGLKQATLCDIVELRSLGMVDRADKYQAILNAIASDINSKHHRRIVRQNELATMRGTLGSLNEKKRFLSDQKESYHSYIRESMASIQKKTKKRPLLPWSMQASHQRKLERSGKSYQFGSYKYSAQTLYDRGILLSIDQHSPRQFHAISLTLSSNEVGVFEIEASYLGIVQATVELVLEDLLEMQFVGKQTVSIGGIAKANLNLLIHQLNKKFFP